MIDVCCALIFQEGHLLAVQRGAGKNHPFQWEFPGGKVEAGESFPDCIVREIREELQIDIVPDLQLGIVEHDYPAKSTRLIPFICKLNNGQIFLTEHHQYRWLKLHELDEIDWQEADRLLISLNLCNLLKWFGEKNDNG